MAYGGNCAGFATNYRIGKSTMYALIEEVCTAIWEILRSIYLKKPTEKDWLQIADDYNKLWDFFNCLGSLDERHFKIRRAAKLNDLNDQMVSCSATKSFQVPF